MSSNAARTHAPFGRLLAAPRDGVVAAVPVAVGDQVAEGALLLQLEPEEAA